MIAGSHKDLARKQFGKLTVMSYAGKSKTVIPCGNAGVYKNRRCVKNVTPQK